MEPFPGGLHPSASGCCQVDTINATVSLKSHPATANLWVGAGKIFFHQKECPALEEAAWVTIPGDVRKPWRCCSWGQGLVVDLAALGEQLGLMISKVFSNPNNSMAPWHLTKNVFEITRLWHVLLSLLLYGFNCDCVESPSDILKLFYNMARTFAERKESIMAAWATVWVIPFPWKLWVRLCLPDRSCASAVLLFPKPQRGPHMEETWVGMRAGGRRSLGKKDISSESKLHWFLTLKPWSKMNKSLLLLRE